VAHECGGCEGGLNSPEPAEQDGVEHEQDDLDRFPQWNYAQVKQ